MFRKLQAALYFRKIFGLFCLDIDKKNLVTTILHQIDTFPGKMTFFINLKKFLSRNVA